MSCLVINGSAKKASALSLHMRYVSGSVTGADRCDEVSRSVIIATREAAAAAAAAAAAVCCSMPAESAAWPGRASLYRQPRWLAHVS